MIKPGLTKKYKGKIAVCVDTSGSMSDEDLTRCYAEIHKISQTTPVEIVVIEADSNISRVYKFDAKKKPSFSGRGGTAYQPAIDKAVELKVDGIMYLGDMDAFDTPTDPKLPFMWVIVGASENVKPPANFGKVMHIDTKSGTNKVVKK